MRRFLNATLLLGALIPGCACEQDPFVRTKQIGAIQVSIESVRRPLGKDFASGKGEPNDPYPFPLGETVFHIKGQVLDQAGNVDVAFDRPLAVKVTPGDVAADTRFVRTDKGAFDGFVRARNTYGKSNIWVVDEPPAVVLATDGGTVPSGAPFVEPYDDGGLPYSFAAGTSRPIYFRTPTIVDVQRTTDCDPSKSFAAPTNSCTTNAQCVDSRSNQYQCFENKCLGTCDNRIGPLTGDFVNIEVPYTGDDKGMIVTGITQSGFYVTDLSATKLDDPENPTRADWQKLPGKFNSIFIYTYSAPANLYVGDTLTQLSGGVSEFSGDTQLNFPAWAKVDKQPTPEFIPKPYELTLTDCAAFPADITANNVMRSCGYYNSNMNLEGLESSPVVVRRARPSSLFVNCDANGNREIPLMVNTSALGGWGCFPDSADYEECACNVACLSGVPQTAPNGTNYNFFDPADPAGDKLVCTELSSYGSFGQWVVELPNSPDGATYTRINVTTRDALATFNPLDLAKPEHQGVTFDIAGLLGQVQAARPRWLIYSRDPLDVCCHPNIRTTSDGKTIGTCPVGVRVCETPI